MQHFAGGGGGLQTFLDQLETPLFAIGADHGTTPTITLHTGSRSTAQLRRAFAVFLREGNVHAAIRVKCHREAKLTRLGTIAAFGNLFRHDWIVYDPTGLVRRVQAINEATAKARALFGRRLAGVHLDSKRRKLHVVLRREVIVANNETPLVLLRDAEALIGHEITSRLASTSARMELSVAASFMALKASCAAVDHETLALTRNMSLGRLFRKATLPFAFAAGLGFAASAFAGNSAVSSINGKIEGMAGDVGSSSSTAAAASIALPVGNAYGVQLDGFVGELSDMSSKGLGAHLFWRDAKTALVGLTGSYSEVADTDMRRVGLEGEYYLNRFTVAAQAGHQSGDVDDAGYGGLDLRYYALDDLMFEIGGRVAGSDTVGHLGIEYQTPFEALPGLAVFADLADGENGYNHAVIGLRFYWGGAKSLVKRHREDDPVNSIFDAVSSGFTAITKARAAKARAAATSSQGPGGGNI